MVQLLYVIASIHTLLCPFTKVEESFNIQAAHDILYHRFNLSEYDHNEFPGPVPRTFIGPLVISALSAPTVMFFHVAGLHKFWMQYVVRLALALTVIGAWSRLKNTLQKLYGNTYTWWFTLITVTQYHFMFYMSRPLPNIMALPLVLLAYEGWLAGKKKQFIILAGASMIIFRSELAMLFGLFLIMDLYFRKIDMTRLLKIAVPAGIGLIALTVAIDSIFWGRILWPEAEVFWYNTVLNKSSDWGTSPFLWYFYSALPRGLGPSILLIPIGLYFDKRMVQVAAPAFVYILLYSLLPHKELRFIIYVFPLLNMASAAACSYIYIRRTKSPMYELLFWGQVMIMVGNIVITLAFVSVAMANYPGGVAISRLHKLLKDEPFVNVHIGNLAAQTGVTRFTQINDHWYYNKDEHLTLDELKVFTHLLMEAKSKYSSNIKSLANTHDVIDSVESFSHISMTYKIMPPLKIKTKPSIFILERRDFREYPYGTPNPSFAANAVRPSYAEEKVINIVEYDSKEHKATQSEIDSTFGEIEDTDIQREEEKEEFIKEVVYDKELLDGSLSYMSFENEPVVPENSPKESEEQPIEAIVLQPDIESRTVVIPKYAKAKKSLDDVKALRLKRKKKAIQKIKSETRKEVVASAKEKLREIMKRHKHIAEELTKEDRNIEDKVVTEIPTDENEVNSPSDIPETETKAQLDNIEIETKSYGLETNNDTSTDTLEDLIQNNDSTNRPNENIDSIVEEVIARLLDRKIYDDKTKPEDIKAEDRLIIQKIVEEVLAERMNYTNSEQK